MLRASPLFLVLALSLGACDVHVREPGPIVVEKKTTVVEEKKPAPVEIHVNDK
jgi:hypothetical protein